MSDLGTSSHWNQACEEVCHQSFQREAQTVYVHRVDQSQAALRKKNKNKDIQLVQQGITVPSTMGTLRNNGIWCVTINIWSFTK